MIGDSPADWKAAEAANVPFVFARYGFGAVKFGSTPPDTSLAIDHARELESVLVRLQARTAKVTD
jgi:phosphoglycolate phosphatase-like HAD superfamily hydrolase